MKEHKFRSLLDMQETHKIISLYTTKQFKDLLRMFRHVRRSDKKLMIYETVQRIEKNNWNVKEAAESLGLSRDTISDYKRYIKCKEQDRAWNYLT